MRRRRDEAEEKVDRRELYRTMSADLMDEEVKP